MPKIYSPITDTRNNPMREMDHIWLDEIFAASFLVPGVTASTVQVTDTGYVDIETFTTEKANVTEICAEVADIDAPLITKRTEKIEESITYMVKGCYLAMFTDGTYDEVLKAQVQKRLQEGVSEYFFGKLFEGALTATIPAVTVENSLESVIDAQTDYFLTNKEQASVIVMTPQMYSKLAKRQFFIPNSLATDFSQLQSTLLGMTVLVRDFTGTDAEGKDFILLNNDYIKVYQQGSTKFLFSEVGANTTVWQNVIIRQMENAKSLGQDATYFYIPMLVVVALPQHVIAYGV